MFKITKIELLKLLKQKKTYIILFMLILLMFTSLKTNSLDMNHIISMNYENATMIDSTKNSINMIKEQLKNDTFTSDEKKEYKEKYLPNAEKELKNVQIIQDKNTDPMDKLKAKIELMKCEIFEINSGKLSSGFSMSQYNMELRYLQHLYDNNIPESKYPMYNSFNYVLNFFTDIGVAIIILLFAILSSDIVSKEMDDSTIKLLLVQPVSRFKVLLGKYMAIILSAVCMLLLTFAVFFIIFGFMHGFGTPSYPVLTHIKYEPHAIPEDSIRYLFDGNSGYFVTSLNLIIKEMLFFILICITTVSVSFMISVLINKSVLAISINVIINAALMYLIYGTTFVKNISQYFYLSYIRSTDVFTGKIYSILQNTKLNPTQGIIVMIITIIISFSISSVVFTKKDM